MNYYYDLILYFRDKQLYKFYEWELEDELWEVKKIPLYKVDEHVIIDFMTFNGMVSSDFVKKLKNRTTYKKNGKINTIMYAAIFTDSKFALALQFDQDGNIIRKSYLMLEDELNVCEIGYSLKKEKLIFDKKSKNTFDNYFRQEKKMKDFINSEIEKLYQKQDFNKLVYYYLEWFKQYNTDIDTIYDIMKNTLNHQIYDLDKIYNMFLTTN